MCIKYLCGQYRVFKNNKNNLINKVNDEHHGTNLFKLFNQISALIGFVNSFVYAPILNSLLKFY